MVPELESSDAIAPETTRVFDALRARIAAVLPQAAIEHIGSSSVSGALTKGDVDVLVSVDDDDFPGASRLLSDCFARNEANEERPGFVSYEGRLFGRDFGVQLCAASLDDYRFLAFRNLLIDSPSVLAEYNNLKAASIKFTKEAYCDAKYEFIERYVFPG